MNLSYGFSCWIARRMEPKLFGAAQARVKSVFAIGAAFCLITLCVGAARAQSFAQAHAKLSLVADGNPLQAGRSTSIGLLFDLDKGWHIYWVNPGDSGEAPKIQWKLPEGFRTGDIHWPTPSRLSTSTVIDYGYEGRVLLPAQLQVPANYNPAKPVTLAADVRYLICREVCIPAKGSASLMIAPGGAAGADAATRRELFRTAAEHSPEPLPAGSKASVTDNGKTFTLSIETGSQEAKATFFPLEEDQIDNAAPQTVMATPRGARITLKKSDQLQKPIGTLKGVVVFGADRAFEIAAPVAGHR